MTNTEIKRFKQVLEETVVQLGSSIRHREAIVVEGSADAMDRMLGAKERDFAARRLEIVSGRLREARVALRRIEEGAYGICASCEEEISPKRLAAIPTAVLCIACQREQDEGKADRGADHRFLWSANDDTLDLPLAA